MPFGASRHVVSLIRFSHHDGCRLVHPDMWYQLNAIRHQDGCRLAHPAKWDIGKFRGAFMTDVDWCIPSSDSFGTLFTSQFRRIPLGESRPYYYSHSFGFQISHFNSIFTFILSFKDKLNLCTYFIYSFIYSFTYTHSYTHSRILIHILIYILIHIFIHVYSFINSFTYTHSRILIHVYLFIYSFTYTHSYIHLHILIHMLMSYTHPCIVIYVYSFIHSFTYTHSCILIYVYSFIHSFTYTHFVYSLSFVIIFWLYVIIIIYHLTTLCVHDILPFMFTFMFQFIFHNHFHVS